MAPKKKRAGVEWVGGVVPMPAYVTGEGEPYRPEVLLWMSADGVPPPGLTVKIAAEGVPGT